MSQARPELATDLYADAAILDPYPLYRTLRDLGPAVWLTAHDAWAIGRFHDVRAALLADGALLSGHGVAMNDAVNGPGGRVTLTSDGDVHRQLRGVLMRPMTASAIREIQDDIQHLADALVDQLMARGSFDGVADVAAHLPLAIVSHLVGLPESGRERMRDWAAATFDALGTMNARAQAAFGPFGEMITYAGAVRRDELRPDGWAARLFRAADDGLIEPSDIPAMLIDYIAPSLDTTILGTGHLLYQLGRHPEQWDLVRAHADLIPRAVDEALRYEAPVRAFSRLAAADHDVGGTTIRAGDRVLVIFGSANRDERRYEDPDRFDVTRDAKDHVGFGHGVHRCAGAFLAQLEMQSLLRAMASRVRRIEVGDAEPMLNNVLRGYRSFPVAFSADAAG
jgi:cytochrome P450